MAKVSRASRICVESCLFFSAGQRKILPMKNETLLKVGIIGTVVAALCCFTPVLVILLGAVGLSAALGLLDLVLLPALALFIAITVYALWKRKKHLSSSPRP